MSVEGGGESVGRFSGQSAAGRIQTKNRLLARLQSGKHARAFSVGGGGGGGGDEPKKFARSSWRAPIVAVVDSKNHVWTKNAPPYAPPFAQRCAARVAQRKRARAQAAHSERSKCKTIGGALFCARNQNCGRLIDCTRLFGKRERKPTLQRRPLFTLLLAVDGRARVNDAAAASRAQKRIVASLWRAIAVQVLR